MHLYNKFWALHLVDLSNLAIMTGKNEYITLLTASLPLRVKQIWGGTVRMGVCTRSIATTSQFVV